MGGCASLFERDHGADGGRGPLDWWDAVVHSPERRRHSLGGGGGAHDEARQAQEQASLRQLLLCLQLLDGLLCCNGRGGESASPGAAAAAAPAADAAAWQPVRRQLQPLLLRVLRVWSRDEPAARATRDAQRAAARLLTWSHADTSWADLPSIGQL